MNGYKRSDYIEYINDRMKHCTLCPRACGVNRSLGQTGFCGMDDKLKIGRASLHMWEEPCISGTRGSGTIFISGCNLKCAYCQNRELSHEKFGQEIGVWRLTDIMFELNKKGAHNINLVTPDHFAPQLALGIYDAVERGLNIPIVYNTSGYVSCETVNFLEGLVDIYLTDYKYINPVISSKLSKAANYPEKAMEALCMMVNKTGKAVINKDGLMSKGVIVRHLVLPGMIGESKKILRMLKDNFGNDIIVSIMKQYTPLCHIDGYPELNRKVTDDEYNRVLDFADRIGLENAYMQEGDTAKESFIPAFDLRGV